MKHWLVGIITVLTLCSCIGLNTRIEINTDGSGEVTLSYRVSRLVLYLGTLDESQRFFAVPVSEKDFEELADRVDGLRLRSFGLEEDSGDVYVDARLEFDDVEALSGLFGITGDSSVTLAQQNGSSRYRHEIVRGYPDGVDADSLEMIETLFRDYEVEFTLTAPRQITSANPGTSSGRTATLEYAVPELVVMRAPLVWEVTW